MGCFSFHPRKAVTTGEGGAVTTNDDALARTVRMLRNHGLDPDAPAPDFVVPGYNLRLTEFQAALGSAQFAKLRRLVDARRRLAHRYDELFADSDVTVPVALAPEAHVYQSYVVLLPPPAKPRRDAIVAGLRQSGIEVTIGTYYMPMTRYFRESGGHRAGDFPVTEDIAGRAVSLPLHTALGDDDQRTVVRALAAAL
jgi:dTDP-4-amino-4,6-dideoxygalactose transaminase